MYSFISNLSMNHVGPCVHTTLFKQNSLPVITCQCSMSIALANLNFSQSHVILLALWDKMKLYAPKQTLGSGNSRIGTQSKIYNIPKRLMR